MNLIKIFILIFFMKHIKRNFKFNLKFIEFYDTKIND